MTLKTSTHSVLLREHGLKVTPQRLKVLELLAASKKPVSIVELQKKSKSQAGKDTMDSVTLYRSLEALVEKALVRPVDLRHGHTDYELVQAGKHHHHIVCESCGAIEDIDWCPEDSLKKTILKNSKHFDKLTDHSLEFFGVCKKCARAQEKLLTK